MTRHLIWSWRHWRARHYVWAADLDYRRYPGRRNLRYSHAVAHLIQVEAGRP